VQSKEDENHLEKGMLPPFVGWILLVLWVPSTNSNHTSGTTCSETSNKTNTNKGRKAHSDWIHHPGGSILSLRQCHKARTVNEQ